MTDLLAHLAEDLIPPHAITTGTVLISYSRKNRDFASTLYAKLERMGFKLWRDIHGIEGGETFWNAIKEAIDACDTVVLCLSPDAITSEYVQAEWHYARQQGKRVLPVIADDLDFDNVPRWIGRVDMKDFRASTPEHTSIWASFIQTLNSAYAPHKVPFMTDPLPDYFVQRPDEFEAIVSALVDSNGAVAITAALQGAGGFGKTTLAMALCHDNRIRGAFDDGILWVTLGEKPTEADLIRKASDLVNLLTGQPVTVTTKEAVKAELAKAIGDRFILLVIDDLWNKHNADIFLTGGENSAVLITTRYDAHLPDATRFKQDVDAMRLNQAVALLKWNVDGTDSSHQPAFEALAKRLGEWAVLLRLVNGTLRKRVQRGDSMTKALEYADKALTRKGLKAFDSDNPQDRHDAVSVTLGVSLDLLPDEKKTYFYQLAIFPEDVAIPFTTLEGLWGLDDFDTEEIATALNDASLLQSFSLETNTIRLHDVVRQYLIEANPTKLIGWHEVLISAWGDFKHLPDDYAWRHIGYHLKEAEKLDVLRGLLLDFDFLYTKLHATDTNALIADCDLIEDDDAVRLVGHALSMSAHVLANDPAQLDNQLIGRLGVHREKHQAIDLLLQQALEYEITQPHLKLISPTLQPAGGALIRTLEGHTSDVNSVALSEEFAVSASYDTTLRVWNWRTGKHIHTLEGHTGGVSSVALSGEFAVSASGDETLRVWNWKTGEHLHTLEGHTGGVSSVALSGEFAVSASKDKTLRVWNWRTGEHLHILEGHSAWVNSVALVGEFAVSASDDSTLRVWNWTTGEHLRTLEGHTETVESVALVGEFAVSASWDSTLQVWNWTTGEHLRTLEGHTETVRSVALSGEFMISASNDNTLCVWNWQTGEHIRTLEGHTDLVLDVTLAGNFVVSASGDNTLRVWNWTVNTLATESAGHTDSVRDVVLSGEFVVSASWDSTLRVWNWRTGEHMRRLEGHTDPIRDVALLGEFAISACMDNMLRVWNWQTGEYLRTLEGHTMRVNSVTLAGDFAVSASSDGTLRVWNWTTGEHIRTLEGHTSSVYSVALSGEFAVLASGDMTLRVWNWTTGEHLRTLEGHMGAVNSVALSGNFAVSASDDRTVRVWNWTTGEYIRTLEGHTNDVTSVALAGNYAVSASDDNTLRVWNWKTGEHLQTFYADSPQYTVTIDHDGEIVVSGGEDGKVHFWKPNETLRRMLTGG